VCKDYFDEYTYALCQIPESKTEWTELVRTILNSEVGKYSDEGGSYIYEFRNELADGFYSAGYDMVILKNLCVYLSILFLLFALLLLSKFILSSMQRQMKQIGILSALGADLPVLCKIYGSAIAVICLAIAALTVIALPFGTNLVNLYLGTSDKVAFDLIFTSPLAILLVVLTIALTAAIGCAVPLIRLRRMEPSTIINKGQIK
jgi:hypothetical protein